MIKIDIYRSFEQWKNGNVLEHGMPRTEYYSEAQLDLVEMGWNYGYDAGRAVEQALDKKAENARELGLDYEPALAQQSAERGEPVKWSGYELDGRRYKTMEERLKDAFYEGFTSSATYNDIELNDVDEEWLKYAAAQGINAKGNT